MWEKKQAQSSNCNNVHSIYQSHGTRKKILKETDNSVSGQHEDTESLFNVADESLKLTLNLPTTTIVAQPFNVIKWQLNFNPVA
jgi:hypothetical protein